jgi:hypothetical protein
MSTIRLAETDQDIARCFPVMAELRPHLVESDFVMRVRRQTGAGGYRLVFLEVDGNVTAVGGFRISECLAWGKFLYLDDLETASEHRFKGAGQRLYESR